jgi:copper chaperone NosL
MWQIQLSAPQYPEGLILRIYPHKLGGNVDVINGLNHYIGMKPIHQDDFVELKVLPYIIAFYAILFLIAAISARRWMLNSLFVLFVFFGIVAMVDFWKWEYNYGHNLNPDAPIIVPGMAYQPPLIGFKQLLNFGAYSIPDVGGWLFVAAGLILLFVVIMEWNSNRKKFRSARPLAATLIFFLLVSLSACNSKPEPIIVGKDNCSFCTMTVSDSRFGAELITKKGKIFKFDDPHCLIDYLEDSAFDRSQVKEIYLTDFSNHHSLIKSDQALLLKSDALKAPMGGNIAAFSNADSLQFAMNIFKGSIVHWDEVYKP